MISTVLALLVVGTLIPKLDPQSLNFSLTKPFLKTQSGQITSVPFDSLNMTLVGRGLYGPSHNSEIFGNTAYLSVGAALQIIDVSDSSNPTLFRAMRTRDFIYGLDIEGNHLYVANMSEGLRIFNITDPWNPMEVGTLPDTSFLVEVFDTLAFVSAGSLLIVNVADSSNPQVIGGYLTLGFPLDYTLKDTLLYVADNGNGLVILNIVDPTNPVLVGTSPLTDIASLEISGDTVYSIDVIGGFGGTSWIRAIDVSDPTNPTQVDSLNFGPQTFAIPMVIEDTIAYVMKYRLVTVPLFAFAIDLATVNLSSGLSIIDDEPIGTVYVLTVPFFDPGLRGVAILGDRVYVAANSEGLVIVDKSDPANLQVLGFLDESSYFADVFFDGQYAYVAALGDGLIILDVLTNPNNPTIVGQFNPGDEIKDVKVQGNKAYLASDLTGMRVVDISNPMNPIEDTLYDSLGGVHNVTVSGNRAYLCTSANGVPMYILDITDPTNPTFLGSYYGGSSFIHDVFVENDTAYVSHWGLGLRIVDVTNPASPVEIGAYNYGGSRTHNAFLSGQYCYIEDEIIPGGFMRVVDVSDPTVPFEAATYAYSDGDPDGYAHNIYVQGNYAHIAYANDGVVIADVSDPLNPTLSGFYDMISYNWGVHPGSSYVYATDSHTGLWIFQFTPPPPGVEEEELSFEIRVLQPSLSHHPNPAKSSARIFFSLPNRIQTRLGIYDLTGRQVQVLVDGVREAGSHSVVWDGRDGRGERVASGVYFVRLSAGDITATKKMILLK